MAGRAKGKGSGLTLASGARPQVRKASKRSWTRAKEKAFLSTLEETCNVTLSAEAAGVSISGVYKRRSENAAFRAAWRNAISEAYQRLELVLLERAFNGTEKLVKRQGGSDERMREYSDRLGLALLKMHRDSAIEASPESAPDNIEEIRERIFEKLERLRKREESRGGSA